MKVTSIYIPLSGECVRMSELKRKKKIKWTARAETLGIIFGTIIFAVNYYILGVALWVWLG